MRAIILLFLVFTGFTGSAQSPLYGKSSYSGGTSTDLTDINNAQLKLEATTGYIRVPHLGAHATIAAVYNFQTGKNVYWGEDTDLGKYIFRGRGISLYADENQTTLGNNTQSVFRLMNGYATAFGRRSEIQFGLTQNTTQTLAVIAAEYSSWDGDVAGDLLFGTTPTGSNAMFERMRINSNGNVGIGTPTPLFNTNNKGLHIAHGDHTTVLLGNPITSGHGGAIQTSDNKHRIFIGANLYDDPSASWKNFQAGKGGAGISVLADEGTWGTAISFYTSRNDNQVTERMVINGDGNVGIGTTAPGTFKLAVNGKIWSQEVNVAMTNPGPDYVFEKNYTLLPLSELETYITQNKHLPEVPSAKEMEANGLNLKEMNLLLLKKVEELTLHLIEQSKINNEQAERISQQARAVEELKNQMISLEQKTTRK